jgi:hypothetical protein
VVPPRQFFSEPREQPGAFFHSLCISGHRTERKLLRWPVRHLRLPTNPVQMASPGPSRVRDGSGRFP